MINDRIDTVNLREDLLEASEELTELLRACDVIDFAANPGGILSEYVDMSDIFNPVDIPPDVEDSLILNIESGISALRVILTSAKGRIYDE